MMRMTILTTVASCLILKASGQNNQVLAPTNLQEKLEYHIALLSEDAKQRKTFCDCMTKEIASKKWNVTIGTDTKMYPDLAFVMDGRLAVLESKETVGTKVIQLLFPGQEPLACDSVIAVKNIKDATRKTRNLIQNFYYRGMRPVYSTVFQAKTEGYVGYRIPSVVSLPNGRVLAITEARMEGKTDCAENNLILKYSDNEGRTWSKPILMSEAGAYSLNNPTTVYIEELNRVMVLFQQYPPKLYEANTDAGLTGDKINRFFEIHSDDNGLTWSAKRDITLQAKQPDATGYASGPGAAIRVVAGPQKGRIIVPVNVSGGQKGWYNYLIASDDLGENWKILPGTSSYGTNESQIIQVSATEFIINARSHRYEGNEHERPDGWNPWNFTKIPRYRAEIPVTIEGNQAQWGATRIRKDMPDPQCQGAIYRYSGLINGEKSRVLFSNAASQIQYKSNDPSRNLPPARINGMVRLSYDNGNTWTWSKRIYGNRFTEFQYSVLTRLPSGRIGCFFETGMDMRFALFDMEWLSSGQDKGER